MCTVDQFWSLNNERARFPIVCKKKGNKLVVLDGQHRLTTAIQLGIVFYYIVIDFDFEVAKVNNTQQGWKARDYAEKYAYNGHEQYTTLLEFDKDNLVPLTQNAALLADCISFSNIRLAFQMGEFKVVNLDWATKICDLYNRSIALSKHIRNSCFRSACIAVCCLEDFDTDRFIKAAERQSNKLLGYSDKIAYLTLIEDIYNFNRPVKYYVNVKGDALQALKSRG